MSHCLLNFGHEPHPGIEQLVPDMTWADNEPEPREEHRAVATLTLIAVGEQRCEASEGVGDVEE